MSNIGVLGELSIRDFLSRYWQKEPLLIRRAIQDWRIPVGLPELMDLARQTDVASRLITLPTKDNDLVLEHGPFGDSDFEGLPESGWTLLVQEIDRRVDGFAQLLERFRFLPNWRIDDVMVSYATDGAGIGPHIDRYDVFLLQAAGRRRWRIASQPAEPSSAESNSFSGRFEFDQEWILETGDMLYLPPNVAHEGVAVGSSLTCSIGFRAPDPRELCAGYLRQLPPAAFESIRFSDPDLQPSATVGEIPADARRRLRDSAQSLFADSSRFDDWLGRFVTTPQRSGRPGSRARTYPWEELKSLIEHGGELKRSAAPHFAWIRQDDGSVHLFVGGESYELGPGRDLEAELLCGCERLDRMSLRPWMDKQQRSGILVDLVLRGFLVPHKS